MRSLILTGAVCALSFLATEVTANGPETQEVDGDYWMASNRGHVGASFDFFGQQLGSVALDGTGVSIPHQRWFAIDNSEDLQRLEYQPRGHLTGTVALTSKDGPGTLVVSRGSFNMQEQYLTLRGTLQFNGTRAQRVVLRGGRFCDTDPRATIIGGDTLGRLRGRRTFSNRFDVTLTDDVEVGFPYHIITLGGPTAMGAGAKRGRGRRTIMGGGGEVFISPRGHVMGFVGIKQDIDPLLEDELSVPRNATLTGRLFGIDTLAGDDRPRYRLAVRTWDGSLRSRCSGQLAPFVGER